MSTFRIHHRGAIVGGQSCDYYWLAKPDEMANVVSWLFPKSAKTGAVVEVVVLDPDVNDEIGINGILSH